MKDLHTQQVPVDRNMKSIIHLTFSAELVTNSEIHLATDSVSSF